MPILFQGLSAITVLVGGWMATMYVLLRHAAWGPRAALALVVCAGAAIAMSGVWRQNRAVRGSVLVWAVGLAALGIAGLVSSNDDGWVLIVGVLFIAEGAVTVQRLSTVR